jgi:hypothetical protein
MSQPVGEPSPMLIVRRELGECVIVIDGQGNRLDISITDLYKFRGELQVELGFHDPARNFTIRRPEQLRVGLASLPKDEPAMAAVTIDLNTVIGIVIPILQGIASRLTLTPVWTTLLNLAISLLQAYAASVTPAQFRAVPLPALPPANADGGYTVESLEAWAAAQQP